MSTPVIVNAQKLEFTDHPFNALGMCNNCQWEFITSMFGEHFWFEGALSPWSSVSSVSLGDMEYFCITNEKSDSKDVLTSEKCDEIIIECTQKMALKIKEFNKLQSPLRG